MRGKLTVIDPWSWPAEDRQREFTVRSFLLPSLDVPGAIVVLEKPMVNEGLETSLAVVRRRHRGKWFDTCERFAVNGVLLMSNGDSVRRFTGEVESLS